MKMDENRNTDEILNRALDTAYGIQINTNPPHTAKSLRRMLYHRRNKLRAKGLLEYDSLSFLAKSQTILWIVNRQSLPIKESLINADIKPLNQSDIPDAINVRGNSKLGLYLESYLK